MALSTFALKHFFAAAVLAAMISCSSIGVKESGKHEADATALAKDTLEAFESFNKRFHADSAFQLSRIAFPLQGKSIEGNEQHAWTRQNWHFLKQPVNEQGAPPGYRRGLNRTDSTVTEKLWIEDSGMMTERRFERKGNKWFLTYFEDVNL
ncbi:hypothetical protein V9K67_04280 [Paraflavisolibacter sp. H34]|uniref:hypothetical protein n=1 Tax=Huijunlia imazamoxiresistens TaxID=3127457 RepID=UPI00301B3ADC